MKRIVLFLLIFIGSFSSLHCQISDTLITGTFIDERDGHAYKWVKIGDQFWMAENLNYETSSGSWVHKKDSSYGSIYGRLYNWETAKQSCPSGWHLPSFEEWTKLIEYLGGKSIAGGKLKEEGTAHWESPNKGATNETGFSGLPGGYHNDLNAIRAIGSWGQWYSATHEFFGFYDCIRYVSLSRKSTKLGDHVGNILNGFGRTGLSVRCVRD
jgi:uncharacterized protein (TIGR02145 family)